MGQNLAQSNPTTAKSMYKASGTNFCIPQTNAQLLSGGGGSYSTHYCELLLLLLKLCCLLNNLCWVFLKLNNHEQKKF